MKSMDEYKRPNDFATFVDISVIWFINFNFLSSRIKKYSNRSFIHFIVAYTDISEIYIFIIREQHVLGFICIDAVLFDFSHLSRPFCSLFISSAESHDIVSDLSPGTQVEIVLSSA